MAEKTEAPTPRHAREARQKGQGVGRSWEFTMGLTLGVGVLALASLLPGAAAKLSAEMQASIMGMSPRISNDQLIGHVGDGLTTSVVLVLPLALLVLAAGIAGNLVSGGLVFAPRAVVFDANRINPIAGLKRLIDKQAAIRLGLATAKLAILGVISYQVVAGKIPQILATQGASIATITKACLDSIFQLGLTITILLAVVALVDFVVQRRQAMESLKMTKEQVRQEYKEEEGDPQIRGARRRKARQLAFARMMDAVPTADVIVTNPTTLAVALKYDSITMRAPKIVAKGQRLVAERIKEIARKNRVPVIEDKPLARALFSRPIGSEVPAHLYRAVARILVLVHQARFGVGGRGRRERGGWAAQGGSGGWAARAGARAAMPQSGRPWWVEAAESVGRTIDEEEIAARHGRVEGGPSERDSASVGSNGEYERGLNGETIPVDEAALQQALAEDEIGDLTPQELAELEAFEASETSETSETSDRDENVIADSGDERQRADGGGEVTR